MTIVVLDTNVLIDLERNNQETVQKLLSLEEQLQPNFAITFVNHAETYFGALQKGIDYSTALLDSLCGFSFLTATPLSSKLYSEIRYSLEKRGEIIDPFDIFIAAIAIENSAILITKDRHFEKISGLKYVIV